MQTGLLGLPLEWLTQDCRTGFAYASAAVLLAGIIILLVKYVFGIPNIKLKWERAFDIFQEHRSRYKKYMPGVYAFFIIASIFLFFAASFPCAFVFASCLLIFFFVRSREDKKRLFFLALVVIFLFWSVYLFQGQDSHVKIFDNLDCHFPQSKILAESGKAFSLNPDVRLDNFIDGLPLNGVDSGYNVFTWLLMLFPPFVAYIINDLLIRVVAFAGMVLLLKKYIICPNEKKHHFIIIGASLCFALLPFYPAGGLSIAGLPLLLFGFLNILNHEKRITDFLIIFLFPFYSKLALAGFFIVIVLSILFVFDCLKRRKINPYLAGALALLIGAYVFTHFHLVYKFMNPEFVSFRKEIQPQAVPTSAAIKNSIHNFIFDRVNVVSAHHLFVIAAAALAVILGIIKKIKTKRMVLLLIAVLTTSIAWGFKYWEGIMALRKKLQILNEFDFARFYWFNPFLWFLIFALALCVIATVKHGNKIATLLIMLQVLFMFICYNWEYRFLLGIKRSFAGSPITYSLTYREFFSESLFSEIDRYIKKPKKDYRIICHGIHPGIANYNGFYTLDVYTDFYPLEYKHRFRRIIEKEIEKSPQLQEVFDRNAKRCYLLTAELHGNKTVRGLAFARGITKKDQHLKIRNLELNASALKEMGGEYIFSGVEILNFEENDLVFERAFQSKKSPWKIYLYRVL